MEESDDLILSFPELLVSKVIEAREEGVRAIITESGTSFSHAAIMVKAFGIPILRVNRIENLRKSIGASVLVNTTGKTLIINAKLDDVVATDIQLMTEEERGSDESPLSIWLNVIDPYQPAIMDIKGEIEGIGLYRSEIILSERLSGFPSEDEQYDVYRGAFNNMGP